MGIFGDLDTDEIPDDPFYIEPNIYPAFCTDMKEVLKSNGTLAVVTTWCIDEPDNDYHGATPNQWLDLPNLVDENGNARDPKDLDAEEKKALSRIKQLLMKGFDVSRDEVNTTEYVDQIGKHAWITIKSSTKNGTVYTNIVDTVCDRIYEERRGETERVSGTLGI